MKAFILAGGFGTRLRPLTLTRPKHLLPIANRPHIEHVFELLLRHGIEEVVMLTSYLSQAFESVFERARAKGLNIEVTLEEEPLGTAGAFKNAASYVGDDRFLAFNGDILTDLDLTEVVDRHIADGAEASIVLTPVEDPSAFGVVPTDDEGRVLGFIEKPLREDAPTNLINAGIYVFEPSVLDRIPEGRPSSAERELFPTLVTEGAPFFAHGTDAYWMDIGTPEKLLQANLDAIDGLFRTDAANNVRSGSLVDPSSLVRGDQVQHSVLGAEVQVDDAALITDSVLLPGARVGRGARVSRSILGEKVVVAAGATVSGRCLGDGETA